MDIYQHDEAFREKGFESIAGIDEAGRGPLAGPVVAAAVILPSYLKIDGLRDSKKVPEQERASLFWQILSSSLDIGVGVVEHDEIDRINILQATRLAMKKAVADLRTTPDALIIDAVTLPSVSIKQFSIIKADSKSASVAAASLIAKYTRDMIMLRYHSLYPEYNFKKHKGYCTKEHVRLLNLYGPCSIHRKSFRKVMDLNLPF
ncbi:MAG: ribonuclease HII [Nitrospira bacterium HGW-Nitrospira-1]|nr:MAG: ribonuclease HII [Nitrospira bacterium HGW-Nitrospira-1]